MKTCTIKGVTIGLGVPKICVPIISTTIETIINNLKDYDKNDIDIIELRIDYFKDLLDSDKFKELIQQIKLLNINKPLLFTYRSSHEGGEIQLSNKKQYQIIEIVSQSKIASIIDIEVECEIAKQLIQLCHQHDTKVILSHHNFEYTPNQSELLETFKKMEDMGGDIAKIAAMPNNKQDVLNLMMTTYQYQEKSNIPIVTMSMGPLGAITRVAGEIYGSSMTFAAIEKTSAPGQLKVEQVKYILDLLKIEE